MPTTFKKNRRARLSQALVAIRSYDSRSLRATARNFHVPVSTLAERRRGRTISTKAQIENRLLTPTEEESLIQWIMSMDEREFPPRVSAVRDMANILLSARNSPENTPPPVGKNWTRRFVDRHDQLHSKYTRKFDHQRALCDDPKAIGDWFRLVGNTRIKYGILDDDTYNFDETGFQMGFISTAKVVTGSEKPGKAPITQPGNREWVTVIEAVCAGGWAVYPMIIYAGKKNIGAWYEELPDKWRIAVSENGWTNDKLGVFWLRTMFDK